MLEGCCVCVSVTGEQPRRPHSVHSASLLVLFQDQHPKDSHVVVEKDTHSCCDDESDLWVLLEGSGEGGQCLPWNQVSSEYWYICPVPVSSAGDVQEDYWVCICYPTFRSAMFTQRPV